MSLSANSRLDPVERIVERSAAEDATGKSPIE
jgi:hypothetical protein